MAYLLLKGHFKNISIVSVYAPASAAEQHDKETFFQQMQALVERLPRRDLLIVAGAWNGRAGRCDSTNSHLICRFGLGCLCENGERLPNFADQNRLFVTSTGFQHRNKHLLTWYSNDGHMASQIDYILRRRRGGQLKPCLDTVRRDMEVVLGPSVFNVRRWRREWIEFSKSAAVDLHAWRSTIRDINEAG
ncbi:unnamed protein product [Schistocephalus solidus]|uniref:Endo/exonuclease/phosphatase domain-containing protein n=1 Tax=Schistocephalus solidus TaxID=70667 RepID=A0A183T4F2_SCHSO|nr:unnamed protein product [Schistocephalus solidus]